MLDGMAPDRDNLLRWIDDPDWGSRLRARLRPSLADRTAAPLNLADGLLG